MIVEKILDQVKKSRKILPQHSNRASSIGYPCLRNNCLQRTHWSQRPLPDIGLQLIFGEGNSQERALKRSLLSAGVDVIRSEESIWLERYKLSGHIDGIINYNGEDILLELKSMNDHLFATINSYADLINSTKIWHNNYVVQLQLYMYAKHCQHGLFLIKSKSNGQLKEILVDLDMDIIDQTLQKCLDVNKCVDDINSMLTEVYQIEDIADIDDKEDREDVERIKQEVFEEIDKMLPDRIIDMPVCDFCDFKHICLPDEIREEQTKLYTESEDFIKKLIRRSELHVLQKEFNTLDKEVKFFLKQRKESAYYIGNEELDVMFHIQNGKQMKITEVED